MGFKDWGSNYINVNFAQPIPGLPPELSGRRLYYRTMPARFARTHRPPWRAKGYLDIGENEITPKITGWKEPLELHRASVTITNGETIAKLRTDYVISGATL